MFCLAVPKNFVGEYFPVEIFSGTEKLWIKGGGAGVSRFAVESFLSHSAEIFRRGIPYCCSNFGYRKSLDKKGVEYQNFPSKVFCLTMPEIFAGEPFCAVSQKISGSEKFMDIQGGVSRFSVENFFLFYGAEICRMGIL